MIEDKLCFINGLDDKTFIETIDNGDAKFYKCPKCGSYHVVKNGTYKRKTPINKCLTKITIIQKYLCKKCKTSFKYLPIYLTSYSHLSSLTLLKVLVNETSFNRLSKLYELSRTTIRSIKKRFDTTYNKIKFLVRKIEVFSYQELFEKYYKEFNEFLFTPSTISANYPYVINQLS